MTSHAQAEQLIAAAFDYPLTPAEETELAAHLAACPTCRALAAAYRSDAASIRTFAYAEPPAFVRTAIFRAGARPAPRAVEPWKLLAAAALLLTALLAATVASGAWNPRPALVVVQPSAPVETSPATIPSPAAAGTTLEAACDGSRSSVATPVVGAQADGVHVTVTNTSGQPLAFTIDDATGLALQGDSVQGPSTTYVYAIEPGAYRFTCHGSETEFTVVDPGLVYVTPVTWCATPGSGGSGTTGTTDYGEGATGQPGSLLEVARMELHGLKPSDVVERAGYPQSADAASVRVVRDGRVVAVVGYSDDGHGGWLIGGIQACAGSGITVKPPAG